MKFAIIYKSRGCNTEKVAKAMGNELGIGTINIDEVHTLPDADVLFIGFAIYNKKPDETLLKYLDNLPANSYRGAVLFSTSCFKVDYSELIENTLRAKNIGVYPRHFLCRGKWLMFAKGRPNEKDLKRAASFAKGVTMELDRAAKASSK